MGQKQKSYLLANRFCKRRITLSCATLADGLVEPYSPFATIDSLVMAITSRRATPH